MLTELKWAESKPTGLHWNALSWTELKNGKKLHEDFCTQTACRDDWGLTHDSWLLPHVADDSERLLESPRGSFGTFRTHANGQRVAPDSPRKLFLTLRKLIHFWPKPPNRLAAINQHTNTQTAAGEWIRHPRLSFCALLNSQLRADELGHNVTAPAGQRRRLRRSTTAGWDL